MCEQRLRLPYRLLYRNSLEEKRPSQSPNKPLFGLIYYKVYNSLSSVTQNVTQQGEQNKKAVKLEHWNVAKGDLPSGWWLHLYEAQKTQIQMKMQMQMCHVSGEDKEQRAAADTSKTKQPITL